jgi:hypothetical protein
VTEGELEEFLGSKSMQSRPHELVVAELKDVAGGI